MAIIFYVNGHSVKIQSNAAFLSTQDESLDSGTLVLEWNEMKNKLNTGEITPNEYFEWKISKRSIVRTLIF